MIPEKFSERMKEMLGDEYATFESALSEKNVRGVRVNTAKISPEDYKSVTELDLSPIPYADYGFIPHDAEGIGTTAEHHAGMIYVQDPGAMATVTALDVERGWRGGNNATRSAQICRERQCGREASAPPESPPSPGSPPRFPAPRLRPPPVCRPRDG